MNLNTLQAFRHGMYDCFGHAKDALFNLVDALASEAGARSFPELSLSPFFERSWASLYEALEDGQIDAERLRQLFVDYAPLPPAGECVFVGVDTSNLFRPEAETAEDRTLVPLANLPKHTHAASPAWVVSHVVLLPTQAGQGTFILDTARVASARRPGQLGASRKDGERFQCQDESSPGPPDATWEGLDATGARIEVRCWTHLHLRQARTVEVSLIQITRQGASGKARDPRISWFVWRGQRAAPLAQISPTYRLRYSHEHGYRFDKQELLWDGPRLSTPERTERWTHLVACAHNLLVLARPLLEGSYRPWERRSSMPTLTQVRRGMPTLLQQLGTPARPPQRRGKAPGRAKGFHPRPRTRHPVIRKTRKKQKTSKKRASA